MINHGVAIIRMGGVVWSNAHKARFKEKVRVDDMRVEKTS